MSYKIKILSDRQYSELFSSREPVLLNSRTKLYLTTVLPGLYYSVTDKMLNRHDERFLFLPATVLDSDHSPSIFDGIVYKEFVLSSARIPVEGKTFVPLVVEGVPVGGLLCDSDKPDEAELQNSLSEFTVSEYFNLIFNINEQLASGESVAIQALNLISSHRSPDQFMRFLPDWLTDYLGGGLASFYYKSGSDYIMRKMTGCLSLYEEMPPTVSGEAAELLSKSTDEGRLFLSTGAMPDYVTELRVPPQVRFLLGGAIGGAFDYLLTGYVPNITSYSVALFFERLKQILTGISSKHFSQGPDWLEIFSSLDVLAAAEKSKQEMLEVIFPVLCEYVNISRISLVRHLQLENRLEVEAAVNLSPKTALGPTVTFPIEDSAFAKVLETGKYYFKNNLGQSLSNKLEYQLLKEGIRSYLLVPLIQDGTIAGILNFGSPMSDDYLRRHVRVFEVLTNHLTKILVSRKQQKTIDIYSRQLDELHSKLASLENLRTMGELAGGVFHDLNNVIGAVLGRCQIVLNRLKNISESEMSEKITRDVKLIEQSALDSGEILKRLREMSRPRQEPQKVMADIGEIINDSVEMIKPKWEKLTQERGLKIQLKRNIEENLKIIAEPSELREVITNLLLNALDALPNGGEVEIGCCRVENMAQVTIGDTGRGVPPEVLQTTFEPSFTTKRDQGTGLGLSVSKKIIEEHGGTIKASSTPEKGTTFTVEVPIMKPDTDSVSEDSPLSTQYSKMRLLIVEDRSDLQEILKESLTSHGFDVAAAGSGEEAMMICGHSKYDVLIVDLGLPGINGIELVSQVKKFDHKIRTILISGWDINQSVQEIMSRGVDSVITKPFKIGTILETLENFSRVIQPAK